MYKIFKSLLFVFILISLSTMIFSSPALAEENFQIAFLNETTPNNHFWNKYIKFMGKACQDLDMELKTYNLNGDYTKMVPALKKIASNDKTPDMIVIYNVKQQAQQLIPIADKAKIPIFIMNSDLTPFEKEIIGKPREKYKYFIGSLLPDDEDAGYTLAKILFNKTNPDKTYHLIGIKGPKGCDAASDSRVKGLKRALSEHDNIVLDQIVAGNWLKEQAKQKFKSAKLMRYKEVSIVWTACDSMALGVAEGAKELNFIPDKDIITGGVDWIDSALLSIKKGELTASVGGHFLEGAWSMVMIYDYLNGIDFASENMEMKDKMVAITKNNIDFYEQKLSKENINQLNFRKFSKKLNPKIKKYDFSVKSLVGQP